MSKKNVEAIYPLCTSQQGMLFETIAAPDSGIHIEQFTCTLHGNLNLSVFKQAWQRIVERHAILRTGFVWKDQEQPLQVVLQQVELPFERQNWQGISVVEQQQKLEVYLQCERRSGFNLSKPPLMRLALFQTSFNSYQFVWTHHHILMDGWCGPLLFKEFLSFYQALSKGQTLHLPLVRPYRDYITWLKKQDTLQTEEFWRKTLQGFTKPTPLGITAEASCSFEEKPSYGEQNANLNTTATNALKSLAKANRLTLNTVVQGIWALLLCRYSGENEVLFGITVSGRPSNLPGIEATIGLFINTLPLRIKILPQQNFWLWLKDIQSYNYELRQYEHSDPGQIHQWSQLPGSLPLYESILVFENYPVDTSELQSSELKIEIVNSRSIGAKTKYALTLLASAEQELELKFVYDKRRLESADIGQISEHFLTLLNSIIQESETKLQIFLDKIPTEQIPKVKFLQKYNRTTEEKTDKVPRTPIEEVLAGIWSEILGFNNFGINDNFFQLGGHSLLATQVMSRLRTAFQVELPLSYLFESPTITGLATRIETKIRTGQGLEAPPIKPISRLENLPLSFAQERLWFLDQLDPDNSTYNDPTAVRLTGSLNIAALEQSLNAVVTRHEVLRTIFPTVDGQPIQVISPATTFTLPVIDLRETKLSFLERKAEAQRIALEEAERPFNLAQGLLLRVMLLQLDETEYVLLLTMHHIISDLWSMGILIRELAALYEAFCSGKSHTLPELPIQYADYAVWQRQWMQKDVLQTQVAYWKQQLEGAPTQLALPTDHPRSQQSTSTGAKQNLLLPKDLSEELMSLNRREGVTLYMSLLAALNTLLYYYTQQEDILVGSPIANRNRCEVEGLIGFFINTLVLRTDLSGNPSFRELLHRLRESTLGAYAHQDLPFEKLVGELHLGRNLNHNPLFQVWFTLQNISTPDLESLTLSLPDLTLSSFDIGKKTVPFDLALLLSEKPEGISGCFEYKSDLFEARTILRMAEHFEMLLKCVVSQPDIRLKQLVEKLNESNQKQQLVKEQEYKNTLREKFMQIKQKSYRESKTL